MMLSMIPAFLWPCAAHRALRQWLLLGVSVLSMAYAPTCAAASALEQLREFASSTRAARGEFTQVQALSNGRSGASSSGTFAFIRPGRFRWEESMLWSQFEAKLKESVPVLVPNSTLTTLKNVEVTRRDRSGRVAELKLSADPVDLTLGGDSVRWSTSGGKIGAGGLQSSLFYLDVSGVGDTRTVKIRGGGWGHGVGMCQEGAAGRAKAGQNYRQLIKHYYPGTVLLSPEPVPTQVFP
jgi:peptidoglycan hydrolase-like amidase